MAFLKEWVLATLLGLVTIPIAVYVVYLGSWNIQFSARTIKKRMFFLTIVEYKYAQLLEARLSYSVTNHDFIMLIFNDKRQMIFRLKDENATYAMKRINSHRSLIRSRVL